MKKLVTLFTAIILSMTALTGCNSTPKDPGPPPSDVVDPGSSTENSNTNNNTVNSTSDSISNSIGNGTQSTNSDPQSSSSTPQSSSSTPQNIYRGEVLENAVSVRIGNFGRKDWYINMYDNAAAQTMLGYLSSSEMRFPTYNYDGEHGFVSQSVRGSYTRNDEITVADVKAGELYLLSGGQLRFYFRDSTGVNITATPIGYYVETDGLADAVIDAYTSNIGDSWGVDVYFNIRKLIN